MNIKQKKENKAVTVSVSGRIDTSTAPELLEYLNGVMPEAEELVLDLQDVEYITSAGLRVILFAQKNMNSHGSMTVAHPNDDIMETFELTGFTDVLNIVR